MVLENCMKNSSISGPVSVALDESAATSSSVLDLGVTLSLSPLKNNVARGLLETV